MTNTHYYEVVHTGDGAPHIEMLDIVIMHNGDVMYVLRIKRKGSNYEGVRREVRREDAEFLMRYGVPSRVLYQAQTQYANEHMKVEQVVLPEGIIS